MKSEEIAFWIKILRSNDLITLKIKKGVDAAAST